jgi:putative ABC transport system ATP-binding protein
MPSATAIAMSDHMLQAKGLAKYYQVANRWITVLDDVSFAVPAGAFLVVEGKSGSGKSTLLSLLSGLDRPDRGSVILDGTDITGLDEDALAPLRNRKTGFVFQSFHLIPSLTAVENIMFPAELIRDPAAADKARELLQRVDLADRMHNLPHQLSGGEKQRVAICRALINEPQVLFADEPTGNLDSVNGGVILELLLALRRERNTTLVLATHSRDISNRADQVVRLADGRIAAAARADA